LELLRVFLAHSCRLHSGDCRAATALVNADECGLIEMVGHGTKRECPVQVSQVARGWRKSLIDLEEDESTRLHMVEALRRLQLNDR
jgi:hypothetical protein